MSRSLFFLLVTSAELSTVLPLSLRRPLLHCPLLLSLRRPLLHCPLLQVANEAGAELSTAVVLSLKRPSFSVSFHLRAISLTTNIAKRIATERKITLKNRVKLLEKKQKKIYLANTN